LPIVSIPHSNAEFFTALGFFGTIPMSLKKTGSSTIKDATKMTATVNKAMSAYCVNNATSNQEYIQLAQKPDSYLLFSFKKYLSNKYKIVTNA
jgi:hypothetical protein